MLSAPPLPRLLCLPHAGGSAVTFHAWRRRFTGHVRVTPVELPGHGTRRGEPLVRDIGPLADRLAGELAGTLSGPYLLFGHSFGALVAFELAHRLRDLGAGEPLALVAGGRNAPAVPHTREPLHDAPADRLARGLRALQGTLPGVAQDPELLEVFLPPLRADLRMAETYRRPAVPRLSCPVLAVAGDLDPVVDEAGLAAWQDETDGPFRIERVRGGHMILDSPALHRELDTLFALDAR